ncbi:MAG: site-2 protease family protein, partial [Cyanobacteria bacterium NC_groundwater_1444_Ag_S-0.65um_54_12]|nr:site-2 protease family protein [Cyanobacteria bacterium NC_groundwater_1444_Ag_S-0.65um_54_12]
MPIVGIIALLAVLIFFHEAGHFLAAKSLRIPVKQFALGFGPALWSFKKDETQYRLNLLPLGGYCAFADDQRTTEPAAEPERSAADASREPPLDPRRFLRNRPLWQRAIVVVAGVFANVVIAWLA